MASRSRSAPAPEDLLFGLDCRRGFRLGLFDHGLRLGLRLWACCGRYREFPECIGIPLLSKLPEGSVPAREHGRNRERHQQGRLCARSEGGQDRLHVRRRGAVVTQGRTVLVPVKQRDRLDVLEDSRDPPWLEVSIGSTGRSESREEEERSGQLLAEEARQ